MNYTRIFVTIASAAIVAAGCDTYDGNQDTIGATGRQGATLRAVHDTGTRTDFDGKASAWKQAYHPHWESHWILTTCELRRGESTTIT